MTQTTLHPTPRLRDVIAEQVRIVGLSLRREAVVALVVLAIATMIVAVDIAGGNAASWFDSDEWFPLGVGAFLFPFAVWRGEKRFGPGFFWTLPFDRRQLALTKVFGGWIWLMTALLFFLLWQLMLATFAGVTDALLIEPFGVVGVTSLYLLGSALVLGLRHPLRWLLGAVGLFILIGTLNKALGSTEAAGLQSGVWRSAFNASGLDTLLDITTVSSANTAWEQLPRLMQRAIATLLALGAGLAALWAAVSRHGERRRR